MKRILAILAVLVLASSAQATTTTWTGGNGNWATTGNWDNGDPSATNDAVIDTNVRVTLTANAVGSPNLLLDNGGTVLNTFGNANLGVVTIGSGGGELQGNDNRNYNTGGVVLGGTLTVDFTGGSGSRNFNVSGVISGTGDIICDFSGNTNSSVNFTRNNTFVGTIYIDRGSLGTTAYGGGAHNWFGAVGNRVEIAAGAIASSTSFDSWTENRYEYYGNGTGGTSKIYPVKAASGKNWTVDGRTLSGGAYDGSGTGNMRIGFSQSWSGGNHTLYFADRWRNATVVAHLGNDVLDRIVLYQEKTTAGWSLDLGSGDVDLELDLLAGYATTTGTYVVFELEYSGATVSGTFANDTAGVVSFSNGWSANVTYAGDSTTLATTGGNDALIYNLVPEPASLALLGVGGVLALIRRRKR